MTGSAIGGGMQECTGLACTAMAGLHGAPGSLVLAWTPLLDPWPAAHDWWWITVVPLALGIAMIYKAYRLPTLDRYWRQVVVMTLQVVVAMIAFALTLFALALWLLPRLPAE